MNITKEELEQTIGPITNEEFECLLDDLDEGYYTEQFLKDLTTTH